MTAPGTTDAEGPAPNAEEIQWTEWVILVPLPQDIWRDEDAQSIHLDGLVSTLLSLSPGGFIQEDHRVPAGDEPAPPVGTLRFKCCTPVEQTETTRMTLEAAISDHGGASVVGRPLDPSWRERWRAFFVTTEVSPGLRICPPWEVEQNAGAPGHTVIIEPGMAFGTGRHETTWLCLERLEALSATTHGGVAMLDVGCGTGILSVAAHKMGLGPLTGVDCDPAAISCARDNLALNQIPSDQVALSTTPVGDLEGTWPLVVANILAHILMDLAPDLARRTAPGGSLILCGVLTEERHELISRFEGLGFSLEGEAERGPWSRLDLRRLP